MNFLVALALSIGFAFAGGFLMLVRKRLEEKMPSRLQHLG